MTIRGSASERALRRATSWLLAFTVLFMWYASLYPFDFSLEHVEGLGRADLMRSLTWRKPPRTDLVANLLFYLPFGALVTSLWSRRWSPPHRVLCTLAVGASLSILIECAQATTVSRDPSITDVTLNGLSAGIAAILALGARGLGLSPTLPELRTNRPDVVAVIIVALWVASHAAPFMPASRFVWYFTNPSNALDWQWSSGAFAGFFAGYVLVAAVLRSLLRRASFWRLFIGLATLSLVARIVFREQRLELNEVAGFVLALPVIWQITYAREQTAYRLALLWAAPAFVFFSLAPFDFATATANFQWLTLPTLTSRLSSGEPGLLEVGFFHAGTVWLLREAQLPLKRILAGMLAISLLLEVIQAWEPGRSAQLAAPVVVVATAALVWLRDRLSVTSRRTVISE
ncbi:MAG: VanZ family protein [Gammaproteobacteria bacterium]